MRKIYLIFISLMFGYLSLFAQTKNDNTNIIPKPQSLTVGEGCFTITPATTIFCTNEFDGKYLQDKLGTATSFDIKLSHEERAANSINILISNKYNIPEEGYTLNVDKNNITVTASTKAGAFYAIQTLLQLMPPTVYGTPTGFETWEIPCVQIEDSPRFAYRGMMLDVSRTFFGLDVLYKYADWLSYHKINKFHLHLADDNGWRIEIKKYPALTQKGAWRGPDEVIPATFGSGDKRYGGFYTQKQMKEFIKYAADRNIEIIPEIDLPGHSRTFAACFPDILCKHTQQFASVQGEVENVFCVGNQHNYIMLENVIKELAALFPSDYIHIGGDEVNMNNWKACPECQKIMKEEGMTQPEQLQNYFVRRLEKIVNKYGKKMAGWDEIIDGGNIGPNSMVYAWRNVNTGIKSAQMGFPTIMQVAQYCYIDMKQSPIERGHNWAAIVTLDKLYNFDPVLPGSLDDSHIKNVIGIQVGLWAELLIKPARFVEYQSFPRICASAEIGWTMPEKKNYEDFFCRLTMSHYDRLSNMGIAFRLPYPDVKYENGCLTVTSPYQGAIIRYTCDKSDPNGHSNVYCGSIKTDNPENYRFATFYGDFNKSIAVGASNIELYKYKTINVTASSSLKENSRFPLSNICDNNFKTYFRSTAKAQKGDYILYSFSDPINCKIITIETGIPNIDFYGVTNGHIEYSYNGRDFITGDKFKDNCVAIYPTDAIKAVKIVIDGPNDGHTLCIQDLKIL